MGSNVIIHGPTINQSDFKLICGAACDQAQNSILTTFIAQGGTFPVKVPKNGSTLPAPASLQITGPASRYCIEGRAPQYTDIIYHATEEAAVNKGPCPSDPTLHYP